MNDRRMNDCANRSGLSGIYLTVPNCVSSNFLYRPLQKLGTAAWLGPEAHMIYDILSFVVGITSWSRTSSGACYLGSLPSFRQDTGVFCAS